MWGYIDHSGKFVIEPRFEEAASFSEELARVEFYDKNYVWTTHKRPNGKWLRGYIDKNGIWAIQPNLDIAHRDFDGGMAIISVDVGYSDVYKGVISETFIIDKKGRKLWELKSPNISWFSNDVIVVVVGKNEKGRELYSFLDRNGKRLTSKTFAHLSEFSEGLAAARIGDKVGVIDKTGEFVIQPSFDWINSFTEGLAGAEESFNNYGYIDKSGKWVIKPQFNFAGGFKDGLALVAIGEKTGYINNSGEYIWKPTK